MNQERMYKVLLGPHISERSALGAELNQYTFRVVPDATKPEVRKAVEQLFKVKVEGVQVMNVKGKRKRNRFGVSRKNNWKKAVGRLAAGHEIDFEVAN